MPPDSLRIVVDENLPWSIAQELRARGYQDATSNHEEGLVGKLDPEVFEALAAMDEEVILVTFDNAMPQRHGPELVGSGIALAVVDSKNQPPDLKPEEYWREVIHRHAHRFVNQAPGAFWKYRRGGRNPIVARVPQG